MVEGASEGIDEARLDKNWSLLKLDQFNKLLKLLKLEDSLDFAVCASA